jgi:hypothetical protein
MGTGNLRPSCLTTDDHGMINSGAAPPRRIVEVARGFGKNGVVQSICQDDFGPALDAIIQVIGADLADVCLPRSLVRKVDGTVGCNVVWELPPASQPVENTPTSCGAPGWEFLLDPGANDEHVGPRGGALCKVAQLAVKDDGTGKKMPVATENDGRMFDSGWYYDDFSTDREQYCRNNLTGTKQRVAFNGANGRPPTGVVVKLECLNEAQHLPNTRTDIATTTTQPTIGDACDQVMRGGQMLSGDVACAVQLRAPSTRWPDMIDRSMFCHHELNVCVLGCNTDADCPPAWVCDARAETRAQTGNRKLCVNPTCGELK